MGDREGIARPENVGRWPELNRSGCLLCGSPVMSLPYPHMGITSDCKPWPRAGTWAICSECGHVQKCLDDAWFSDIGEIYRYYEMYPLSDGREQVVFQGSDAVPRTLRLMNNIRSAMDIQERGTLLDIGCGNGSLLRTFNSLYPEWELFGYEQNDANQEIVEDVPGVCDFYCDRLDDIHRSFDIITMLYVIEHLPDPTDVLRKVRNLLKPDGLLILQTSYFGENPFDLVVVDHCSHFTAGTLTRLIEVSGYNAILHSDTWMPREISVIGKISNRESRSDHASGNVRDTVSRVRSMLAWLEDVSNEVRAASREREVGIFGTAIAGSWLAGNVGECARFFVDEDTSRQGKYHNGLMVIPPGDVSQDSVVYLAFPPKTANTIYTRLKDSYPSMNVLYPRSQYQGLPDT